MGRRLTKPKIKKWHGDTAKERDKLAVRIREVRSYTEDAKGGRHMYLMEVLRDMIDEHTVKELVVGSIESLAEREGVEL